MPKLPKAKIVKLTIDELAAVDEGAQDAQGTVLLKRKDTSVRKATWSTAYVDSLPDTAFLYIEGGGKKDASGKTEPRSLRHFPYRDLNGSVDLEHARAAAQMAPKSSLPADVIHKVQIKAEKLVAKEHTMNKQALADLKKRGAFTALKKMVTVQKRGMLTTADDGHCHLLDDGDGAASGVTDAAYLNATDPYGATSYHWHPWARSTDGTIMIGEAAGHTHLVLTPDQLQQILDADDADVEEEDAAIVKARAKSTPHAGVNHAATTPEGTMPTEHEKQIVDLTKRTTTLAKMLLVAASLPDAHRSHVATLEPEAAETFLAKSHVERETEVAKALEHDPIEVEVDGVQYRKSAGAQTIALAKRAKANEAELAKARDATETTRLEKRARETVGNLGGTLPISTRLMKAIEREFTDSKEQDQVVGMLKFASKLGAEAGKPNGIDPGENPAGGHFGDGSGDPLEQFNAEVKKFKEAKGLKDEGEALEKFLGTSEGKVAKRRYDATRGYGAGART